MQKRTKCLVMQMLQSTMNMFGNDVDRDDKTLPNLQSLEQVFNEVLNRSCEFDDKVGYIVLSIFIEYFQNLIMNIIVQ